MNTFREVIDAWPGPTALARDLGLEGNRAKRVDMWKARGRIPEQYWYPLTKAAHVRGIKLDIERLASIAASNAA